MTVAEPEEQWRQMKIILQETTAEIVGLSTRKHQNWFDEADKEIQELLEKKCSCHNRLLAKPDGQAARAAYKTACSTLQANLRTMHWSEHFEGLFSDRHTAQESSLVKIPQLEQ